MGARRESTADRQAIDAARAQGITISARQLERWRQANVIPRAARRSLGRGRGTTSTYSDDEVIYILEFARRIGPKRPPPAVVLWTFLDGHDVPEQLLRDAYAWLLTTLTDVMSPPDEADPIDAVTQRLTRGRSAAAREFRRRLRSAFDFLNVGEGLEEEDLATGKRRRLPRPAFNERIILNQISVLMTGHADPDAVGALAVLGLTQNDWQDAVELDAAFVEDFGKNLGTLSVSFFEDLARNIPLSTICLGRDFLLSDPSVAKMIFRQRRPGLPEADQLLSPLTILFPLQGYASARAERPVSFNELIEVLLIHENRK